MNMLHEAWPSPKGLRVITFATSFESAGSTFGPFLLNRYALTWIVQGGGVTHLDEHAEPTSPGTVLCMRPGMMLRHDWGAQLSTQSFIVFDIDGLPRSWPKPERWPRRRQLLEDEAFLGLFRYLIAAEGAGPVALPVLASGVELLLRMYVTGLTSGVARTSAALPSPVERALDFMRLEIKRKPESRFSLPDVAKAARLTPQHLCRLFRRELEASPIECAHLIRLEQAAGVLERSDHGLAEIADQFGYSSAFHLSRTFKRIYGLSPSEYRTAFREGVATRPGGLVFRHHRLRRYIYESAPGRVVVATRGQAKRAR
jgi:AraC-like DNA-binding protein